MELRGRLAVLAIGQVHMPCSHARMTRAVQVACKPAQDRPPSSAELESHRGVELPRKGKALKNQHQLQRAQISVNRHHMYINSQPLDSVGLQNQTTTYQPTDHPPAP